MVTNFHFIKQEYQEHLIITFKEFKSDHSSP